MNVNSMWKAPSYKEPSHYTVKPTHIPSAPFTRTSTPILQNEPRHYPVSHCSSASEPLNLLMSHYVSPASMSFKLASKSHHWAIASPQRASMTLKWASKTPVSYHIIQMSHTTAPP